MSNPINVYSVFSEFAPVESSNGPWFDSPFPHGGDVPRGSLDAPFADAPQFYAPLPYASYDESSNAGGLSGATSWDDDPPPDGAQSGTNAPEPHGATHATLRAANPIPRAVERPAHASSDGIARGQSRELSESSHTYPTYA